MTASHDRRSPTSTRSSQLLRWSPLALTSVAAIACSDGAVSGGGGVPPVADPGATMGAAPLASAGGGIGGQAQSDPFTPVAAPTTTTPGLPGEQSACSAVPVPGSPVFVRLSAKEYSLAAFDLTGLENAGDFIRRIETAGFVAASPTLSDKTELNAYATAADLLAAAALESTAELSDPSQFVSEAFVQDFLQTFGARVFRRPLNEAETSRYLTVYQSGLEYSPEDAVRWMLAALFASPHFIYRVERGAPTAEANGVVPLTSWELASRLSFFYSGSAPDLDLREAAEGGRLETTEEILNQARRLVQTERGRSRLVSFFSQWVGVEDLDAAVTDRLQRFDSSPEVSAALQESLERLVEHVAFEQQGTFADLLASPMVFVNQPLAESWGIAGVSPEAEFQSVEIPEEHRLGILTHPAALAVHSTNSFANASLRGAFIAEHVLCTPVPEPDAAVFSQFPVIEQRSATNRQTLEQQHMTPACAGCHSVIDPLGVAFENFDQAGRFVSTEQHDPHPETAIDASGSVSLGGLNYEYQNAAEFVSALSQSDAAEQCLSRHVLRFMLKRQESPQTDRCTLERLSEHVDLSGGQLTELFVGLAATDAFRFLTVADTQEMQP